MLKETLINLKDIIIIIEIETFFDKRNYSFNLLFFIKIKNKRKFVRAIGVEMLCFSPSRLDPISL